MTIWFVSGHLDLTAEEFAAHYRPRLEAAAAAGDSFVVGDAAGADVMAQQWLAGKAGVTVFHMLERPRNLYGPFALRGGFTSDSERDAAMTAASNADLAWVRPGRERSGTQRNLLRRTAAG